MTLGSILLGVALLLLVGLVVSRPFLVAHYGRQESRTERQALEAQKDALLVQIRDLDFDYETGKVPDDVHEEQRAALVAEAAALLQRLDQLQPAAQREGGDVPAGVDEDIEAAVARVRGERVALGEDGVEQPVAPQGDVEAEEDTDRQVEAAVARLRQKQGRPRAVAPQEQAGSNGDRYCSQCGQPREASDKFCAYCGHHFA